MKGETVLHHYIQLGWSGYPHRDVRTEQEAANWIIGYDLKDDPENPGQMKDNNGYLDEYGYYHREIKDPRFVNAYVVWAVDDNKNDIANYEEDPGPSPDPDTPPGPGTIPGPDTTPDPDATPGPDTTPGTDATPGPDTTPGTDATPDPSVAPTPWFTSVPVNTSGPGGGHTSPSTGDDASVLPWLALLLLSGACLVALVRNKRLF